MKFIQKNPKPETFIKWKQQATEDWQPNWDNLQKPEKAIVHTALIMEQGHICCYCGQRITQSISHIEHFQPRTYYPDLSLSYNNFLASCPGYSEKQESKTSIAKLPQEFCAQRKGSWFDLDLTVSPLKSDCASYFRYTRIGELLPSQDLTKVDAAKATIKNLGLDNPKLIRLREAAIDGAMQGIEALPDEDIQKLIDGYNRPDNSGKYTPFWAAVIYTLKQIVIIDILLDTMSR
jgi:uncharacterized protein (TIGR02646 family)